jgi:hypothetical protein
MRAANRFLRPDESESPAAESEKSAGTADLNAFTSELKPAPAPPKAKTPNSQGSRWLVAGLTALVCLEAIPTALWVRQQGFASFLVTAQAAAPTLPSVPSPLAAITLCEPTAAPVEMVPANDADVGGAARPSSLAAASVGGATAPAMLAGLVAIESPVPAHVYERGRLVGTTDTDTIMLPVGIHDLEFVNDDFGYSARRSVTVQTGRTTALRLEAPTGTLHVNALPWAEVWIDNQRIGETPIGNLQIPIGIRELVFRHPELGERRATVRVTLKNTARVSMDLRQK